MCRKPDSSYFFFDLLFSKTRQHLKCNLLFGLLKESIYLSFFLESATLPLFQDIPSYSSFIVPVWQQKSHLTTEHDFTHVPQFCMFRHTSVFCKNVIFSLLLANRLWSLAVYFLQLSCYCFLTAFSQLGCLFFLTTVPPPLLISFLTHEPLPN